MFILILNQIVLLSVPIDLDQNLSTFTAFLVKSSVPLLVVLHSSILNPLFTMF